MPNCSKKTADGRGVGVKNGGKFADVLNGWSLTGNGNYVNLLARKNREILSSKLISGGFLTFETTSVRRSQDSASDRKICFGIIVYFGSSKAANDG